MKEEKIPRCVVCGNAIYTGIKKNPHQTCQCDPPYRWTFPPIGTLMTVKEERR